MTEFLPNGGKRLWAERREWSNNVDFVLFERIGNSVSYSTQILMKTSEEGEDWAVKIDPPLSLRNDEVQELMDNLWRIGFRPSEGTGSAGALAATQKHLEDMRKIAFDALEKK